MNAAAWLLLALFGAADPGVPNPDLGDVEPPVRELIEARRQAVLDEPGSAEHWGALGMALDIHDFDTAADACYRRALELDPSRFAWAYYRAMALAELADPVAAAAFEAAVALDPGFSPLLVRYGDLLLGLGRMEDAEKRYRQAIEADGDGAGHALLGLARLAAAAGDLAQAIAHAEQALAAAPRLGPAHGLLAELHRRAGEPKKAAEARRQLREQRGPSVLVDRWVAELMELGASSYWLHERGQFLLASRRPRLAEEQFRAAIELTPHAQFHESLARALLVQELYDEAEASLRRALELAPELASSHLLLGRLYARTGRRSEAVAALRRAAELRPGSPAVRELGEQLLAAGERREGMLWLEKSLAVDEDVRVLLAVAFYYATTPDEPRRDPPKAERLARRLLELTGERPEAWDALGASLAAQGRFEEAVPAAERALELAEGRGSPLVLRLRQRLALYRAGRPFIAPR